MIHSLFRARRWALALTALSTTLLAVALVWYFTPRYFRDLTTAELAAVAALLVLPLVTALAVMADRRRGRTSREA